MTLWRACQAPRLARLEAARSDLRFFGRQSDVTCRRCLSDEMPARDPRDTVDARALQATETGRYR
jgi:hypothetical protein